MNPDQPTDPNLVSTPPTQTTPVVTSPRGGALATVSFIFAILAFLTGFFFMGIVFGIVAIGLGILSIKKQSGDKKLAKAAIIIGGIGLLSGIIFTILTVNGVFGGPQNVVDRTTPQALQAKALIDSKKKFTKGETARFGLIDIQAGTLSEPYTDRFVEEGKEYRSLTVKIKNPDADSQRIVNDLKLNADGVIYGSQGGLNTVTDSDILPGETVEGNLVFEITPGATKFKLQYTRENVQESYQDKSQRLVWTLDL